MIFEDKKEYVFLETNVSISPNEHVSSKKIIDRKQYEEGMKEIRKFIRKNEYIKVEVTACSIAFIYEEDLDDESVLSAFLIDESEDFHNLSKYLAINTDFCKESLFDKLLKEIRNK